MMAFFNLTQLGPQNLYRTASTSHDAPEVSGSGRRQDNVVVISSRTLEHGCSKEEGTSCEQPVMNTASDKVRKVIKDTPSTSKSQTLVI